MADGSQIPDHDAIRALLEAEGAPSSIVLDIGGSEDLNGDGLVSASLVAGLLVFEDV